MPLVTKDDIVDSARHISDVLARGIESDQTPDDIKPSLRGLRQVLQEFVVDTPHAE
jgi:hypothetical protein